MLPGPSFEDTQQVPGTLRNIARPNEQTKVGDTNINIGEFLYCFGLY